MIRVYNHNRTYRLEALDGSFMMVPANAFVDIPEKFTGDITYKTAIAAGEIETFNTTKQGDALEAKAVETAAKKKATAK